MSKAAVTLSIHLDDAEDLDLAFDQIADMLSDLESSDISFSDSFVGGSVATGNFEVSIVSEATNESEAKNRAEKALIGSIEEAKQTFHFSYQVKNIKIEYLENLATTA